MGIYSNYDLGIIYEAYNSYFSENTNFVNVVLKVDHESGKTLWAKAFIDSYQDISWHAYRLTIFKNSAWIFIDCALIMNYFGAVMKIDTDGNIVFSKAFSNSLLENVLDLRYFVFGELVPFDDTNIILNGKVAYGPSRIGYSPNSYIDQIIFNADQDLNINWATILDYKLSIDTKNLFVVYGNLIYSSTFAANYYP